MTELGAAARSLATGRASPQATAALESASRQLATATAAMAQQALGAVETMPADPSGAGAAAGAQPGGAGGAGGAGGGAGGGRTGKQGVAARVPTDVGRPLGDAWQGANGKLASDDRQGDRNEYNDYYRNANQRYLRQVQEMGRK